VIGQRRTLCQRQFQDGSEKVFDTTVASNITTA